MLETDHGCYAKTRTNQYQDWRPRIRLTCNMGKQFCARLINILLRFRCARTKLGHNTISVVPVSYTHLDVYKRQPLHVINRFEIIYVFVINEYCSRYLIKLLIKIYAQGNNAKIILIICCAFSIQTNVFQNSDAFVHI